MKKLLPFILIAILVVTALSLTACNDDTLDTTTEFPCYDMALSYDGENTVTFSEDVFFSARDNLDDLKLHLYPNAFSETATAPISQYEWDKVQSFGKIEILSAKIDRQNCDFVINGVDDTILSIPASIKKDENVTLSISGIITLPECVARFGKNDETVNLTGFYPVLCARKDGMWIEDGYSNIGDPFCLDTADYFASVSYPAELVLASSGTCETVVAGDLKTTEISAEKLRDFALVFSSSFKTATAETSNGVEVNYFYLDDDTTPLDIATTAVETFSSAFGDYPYPYFTLVQAPLPSGGMEYGALAVVSPISGAETVLHETAHQWWYNVVGNDQIRESWLDEGLTEFSTAYFFALMGKEDYYSSFMKSVNETYSEWKSSASTLAMTAEISTLSETDYTVLSYVKGAMLFDTLRTLVGDEKLLLALSTYYRNNAYSIATANDLVSAFDEIDVKAGGIIRSFVEGKEMVF